MDLTRTETDRSIYMADCAVWARVQYARILRQSKECTKTLRGSEAYSHPGLQFACFPFCWDLAFVVSRHMQRAQIGCFCPRLAVSLQVALLWVSFRLLRLHCDKVWLGSGFRRTEPKTKKTDCMQIGLPGVGDTTFVIAHTRQALYPEEWPLQGGTVLLTLIDRFRQGNQRLKLNILKSVKNIFHKSSLMFRSKM